MYSSDEVRCDFITSKGSAHVWLYYPSALLEYPLKNLKAIFTWMLKDGWRNQEAIQLTEQALQESLNTQKKQSQRYSDDRRNLDKVTKVQTLFLELKKKYD